MITEVEYREHLDVAGKYRAFVEAKAEKQGDAELTKGLVSLPLEFPDLHSTSSMSLLQAALFYATLGWRVIPLTPGGKVPHPDFSQNWPQRASNDPDTVVQWWRDYPNANIGICPGGSGIEVLDLDAKQEGQNGVELFKGRHEHIGGPAAATPNNGIHRVFKRSSGLPNKSPRKGGFDLLVDRRQFVVAPSTVEMPNGSARSYRWTANGSPQPMTAELIRFIEDQSAISAVGERDPGEAPERPDLGTPVKHNHPVNTDNRSDGMYHLAQNLYRDLIDPADILATLWDVPEYRQAALDRRGTDDSALEWLWRYTVHRASSVIVDIPIEADDGYDPRSKKLMPEEAGAEGGEGLAAYGELFADVDVDALPDETIIIESTLPADVALLAGPGSARKSTLVLLLAAHVVLGKPIGRRNVNHPGPVVIVTKEDKRSIVWKRFHRILNASGFSPEETAKVREAVKVYDLRTAAVNSTRLVKSTSRGIEENEALVNAWIEELAWLKPSLIVFDPVSGFGGGEAKVNDAEMALMQAGGRISEGTGSCVLFVHHVSQDAARNKVVDQWAGRGGSALGENARAVNVMHRFGEAERKKYGLPEGITKEEVEEKRVSFIVTPKFNYGPEPDTILYLKFGPKGNPWNLELLEGGSAADKERTEKEANDDAQSAVEKKKADLLKLLQKWKAEGVTKTKEAIAEDDRAKTATGLGRNKLRGLLDEMLDTGVLEAVENREGKSGPSRKYYVPAESTEGPYGR